MEEKKEDTREASNAQVIEIDDSDSSPENEEPETEVVEEEIKEAQSVVKEEIDEKVLKSRKEMEELERELGDEERKEKERVVDELKKQLMLVNQEYQRRCSRFAISRIRKIAKNDPEYMDCTKDAMIATAFATELFVQTLTYETLIVNGSVPYGEGAFDKEPQTLQKDQENDEMELDYKSISESVGIVDHFQFLVDIIPKTKNLRDLVKESKVRYSTTSTNVQKS
ncbi:DNA polymerase epsilon subunit C [Nakaseomyces bracarensis]|uniref:DNA polymerase epsilon subunit C n=1 Tax=Nakaseomyces bracarensis TaxID=273131 RepID=A0ABR4NVG6_9SACH